MHRRRPGACSRARLRRYRRALAAAARQQFTLAVASWRHYRRSPQEGGDAWSRRGLRASGWAFRKGGRCKRQVPQPDASRNARARPEPSEKRYVPKATTEPKRRYVQHGSNDPKYAVCTVRTPRPGQRKNDRAVGSSTPDAKRRQVLVQPSDYERVRDSENARSLPAKTRTRNTGNTAERAADRARMKAPPPRPARSTPAAAERARSETTTAQLPQPTQPPPATLGQHDTPGGGYRNGMKLHPRNHDQPPAPPTDRRPRPSNATNAAARTCNTEHPYTVVGEDA